MTQYEKTRLANSTRPSTSPRAPAGVMRAGDGRERVCPYCGEALPPFTREHRPPPGARDPGDRLGRGRYVIHDYLDHGGMGIVYAAHDKHLQRLVALKTLPPEREKNPDRRRRFFREARVLGRLAHPGVNAVFDFDADERTLYIVVQFITGASLTDYLNKVHGGRPLPPSEAIEIAVQVARALGHAHVHGVVHRDIKPDNIMLWRTGEPVVVDFGLAQDFNRPAAALARAGRGLSLSLPYAAPEQIEQRKVGPPADVYAVGEVLYEMLTGRQAFELADMSELVEKKREYRNRLPLPIQCSHPLPPSVNDILSQCLEMRPRDRYRDGNELAVELMEALSACRRAGE